MVVVVGGWDWGGGEVVELERTPFVNFAVRRRLEGAWRVVMCSDLEWFAIARRVGSGGERESPSPLHFNWKESAESSTKTEIAEA